jgi:hypothetical protein
MVVHIYNPSCAGAVSRPTPGQKVSYYLKSKTKSSESMTQVVECLNSTEFKPSTTKKKKIKSVLIFFQGTLLAKELLIRELIIRAGGPSLPQQGFLLFSLYKDKPESQQVTFPLPLGIIYKEAKNVCEYGM